MRELPHGNAAVACGLGACDLGELERECDAGLDSSCNTLGYKGRPDAWLKVVALLRAGCKHQRGIDCGGIAEIARIEWTIDGKLQIGAEEGIAAAGRACELTDGVWCTYAARRERALGDIDASRYYLEVACQEFDDCDALYIAYSELHYPELFPGRTAEVKRYICTLVGEARCNDPDELYQHRQLLAPAATASP